MAEIPPKIKANPVHTMMLSTPNKGWKIIRKEKIRVRIPPANTHPQLETFQACNWLDRPMKLMPRNIKINPTA